MKWKVRKRKGNWRKVKRKRRGVEEGDVVLWFMKIEGMNGLGEDYDLEARRLDRNWK